jgi:hypothetical protein
VEKVLLYLYEQHPSLRHQADIMAGTDLSRGVVGPCLKFLRDHDLVHEPCGKRSGSGLTTKGLSLAGKVAPRH